MIGAAALPMYDWPELRDATDAFWEDWRDGVRARGVAAPDALDRERPRDQIWRDPGLVVAQTCGWPYVDRLVDIVRLVATPIYNVDGCDGPLYSSVVVARRDDPATSLQDLSGRRFALNGFDSLSGWRAAAPDLPATVETLETGAHRASMVAVAEGRADAAAIDAVCWAYAEEFDAPTRAALRPIAWTSHHRALPFVTAIGRSDAETEAIASALRSTLASDRAASACARLRLVGAAPAKPSDYQSVAALAGPGASPSAS